MRFQRKENWQEKKTNRESLLSFLKNHIFNSILKPVWNVLWLGGTISYRTVRHKMKKIAKVWNDEAAQWLTFSLL